MKHDPACWVQSFKYMHLSMGFSWKITVSLLLRVLANDPEMFWPAPFNRVSIHLVGLSRCEPSQSAIDCTKRLGNTYLNCHCPGLLKSVA